MYVCICKGIRFSEMVDAAKSRGTTPEDLMETFGFDDADACGRCASQITELSVMAKSELGKSDLDLAVA